MSSSPSRRDSNVAPANKNIDRAIQQYLNENKLRAGSFVVTLFGDVISQHGNCVWLGSIINCLEGFGLNARQVRTAVGRLVQENWLESRQVGRKSYYSFTQNGQRQFMRAARRIYARKLPDWDGNWTLVLITQSAPLLRDRLRRELGWLGFGQLNGNSFAHPSADKAALSELLSELGIENNLLVMRAATDTLTSEEIVKDTVYRSWTLEEMKPRYVQFCQIFGGTLQELQNASKDNSWQMFRLRLLLIHEYRRMLLKTTELPDELLPSQWLGSKALGIASALYAATGESSLRYIEESFQSINGGVSSVEHSFHQRFA